MEYINLPPKEFKIKSEASDKAVVLDVRTPEEKSEGDIPNSVLMDLMDADFISKVNSLDKDKEYFVFCRSGGRSTSACDYMSNLGLKCYNLEGGIQAWNSEFEKNV